MKFFVLTLMASLIAAVVHAQTPVSPTALPAAKGGSVGNGSDDPNLALNPEQLDAAKIRLDLSALQLTREEIQKRDERLAPLFANYGKTTLEQVAKTIEATFGSTVYRLSATAKMNTFQGRMSHDSWSFNRKVTSIGSKKDVLSEAATYYLADCGFDIGYYDPTPEREIHGPNTLTANRFSALDGAELPGRNALTVSCLNTPFNLESGTKSYWDSRNSRKWEDIYHRIVRDLHTLHVMPSPTLLATYEVTVNDRESKEHAIKLFRRENYFYKYTTEKAAFTTLTQGLPSAAAMGRFIEAMRRTKLKALDAMLVFVPTLEVPKAMLQDQDPGVVNDPRGTKAKMPYHVIYPNYSLAAPIPTPIIYISASASARDIVTMLENHAPRIFAYNKLFELQLLPSAADLYAEFQKHPRLSQALVELEKKVGKENATEHLRVAFLQALYVAGFVLAQPINALVHVGQIAADSAAFLAEALTRPIIIDASTTYISQRISVSF